MLSVSIVHQSVAEKDKDADCLSTQKKPQQFIARVDLILSSFAHPSDPNSAILFSIWRTLRRAKEAQPRPRWKRLPRLATETGSRILATERQQ
jgi:hypothetical protein